MHFLIPLFIISSTTFTPVLNSYVYTKLNQTVIANYYLFYNHYIGFRPLVPLTEQKLAEYRIALQNSIQFHVKTSSPQWQYHLQFVTSSNCSLTEKQDYLQTKVLTFGEIRQPLIQIDLQLLDDSNTSHWEPIFITPTLNGVSALVFTDYSSSLSSEILRELSEQNLTAVYLMGIIDEFAILVDDKGEEETNNEYEQKIAELMITSGDSRDGLCNTDHILQYRVCAIVAAGIRDPEIRMRDGFLPPPIVWDYLTAYYHQPDDPEDSCKPLALDKEAMKEAMDDDAMDESLGSYLKKILQDDKPRNKMLHCRIRYHRPRESIHLYIRLNPANPGNVFFFWQNQVSLITFGEAIVPILKYYPSFEEGLHHFTI